MKVARGGFLGSSVHPGEWRIPVPSIEYSIYFLCKGISPCKRKSVSCVEFIVPFKNEIIAFIACFSENIYSLIC